MSVNYQINAVKFCDGHAAIKDHEWYNWKNTSAQPTMTHKPSSSRHQDEVRCWTRLEKQLVLLCNKGHGIADFIVRWSRKWSHFHSFIPLHVCGLAAPLLWGSVCQTTLMWAWMHSLPNSHALGCIFHTISRNHARLPYLITEPRLLAFLLFPSFTPSPPLDTPVLSL